MCCSCRLYFTRSSLGNAKLAGGSGKSVHLVVVVGGGGGVCVWGGWGVGLCVRVCVCVYHKVSFHKMVSFNVHFVD